MYCVLTCTVREWSVIGQHARQSLDNRSTIARKDARGELFSVYFFRHNGFYENDHPD